MKFCITILMSDKAIFVTKKIKCDGGTLHNDKMFNSARRCNYQITQLHKANTWEKIIIFMISIKFSCELTID